MAAVDHLPRPRGDGVAAFFYLSRHLQYNVDLAVDGSHGANNDLWLFLGAIGAKQLCLMLLISFNIPHGPWSEDARFSQCATAFSSLLEEQDAASCPLFQNMLPQMLNESAAKDLAGDDTAQNLWSYLMSENPFMRTNSKLVKSRFMAFCRFARQEAKHFTLRAFVYIYVCLEMGWLSSWQAKAVSVLGAPNGEFATGSTSSKREAAEEKALRQSCQNHMVLAAVTFGQYENGRKLRAILQLTLPLEEWHSHQNTFLRSVSASVSWSLDQVSGGFMAHLVDIARATQQEASLTEVPFILPRVAQLAQPLDDMEIDAEDSLATMMCDGALSLCGFRLMRHTWQIRGWPSRLILLLRPAIADLALQSFRKDYNNFMALSSNPHGFAGMKALTSRSVFHLTCVRQCVETAKAHEWTVSPALVEHVRMSQSRLLGSQIVEDGFNRQKNAVRMANRRGTVQRSMSSLMEAHVLDQVHHFTPLPASSSAMPRGDCLPDSVFRAQLQSLPKELLGVMGKRASVDWYTSTPHMYCRPFADLAMSDFVHRFGLERMVDNAWLGCIFSARHHVLVRHMHAGDPSQWMFPIIAVDKSVCIWWPVVRGEFEGGGEFYTLQHKQVQLWSLLIPLLDMSMWQAQLFEWRSPAWQGQHRPASCTHADGFALRAFPTSGTMTLLEACAHRGFWNLGLQFLLRLGGYLQVAVSKDMDLTEVLERLLKHILGVSDEGLLKFLEARVAAAEATEEALNLESEVANMDEAEQLLDKADVEQLKKLKEEKHSRRSEFGAMVAKVAEKRRSVTTARTLAGEPPKKISKEIKPPHRRRVPEGPLTQHEARMLMPPMAFIWRSSASSAWCARHPPMKQVSRSWALHGHREAALLCIAEMWKHHRALGYDTVCAIDGLPDGAPGGGLTGSASASSSVGAKQGVSK